MRFSGPRIRASLVNGQNMSGVRGTLLRSLQPRISKTGKFGIKCLSGFRILKPCIQSSDLQLAVQDVNQVLD